MTTQFLSFSLVLCLVTDCFLNMAYLQAIFQTTPLKRALLLLSKDLLVALPVSFILFFLGKGSLVALKTPECAVLSAAGALIALNGLKASFNRSADLPKVSQPKSLFFPVATPLIIGPTWLSGCFVLITKNLPSVKIYEILMVSWAFLFLGSLIMFVLARKNKVLQASRAIIGLFVSIIGVQIFIKGLQLALLSN